MADPFSVDSATLVVQAEAFAAQIGATPALAEALPTDAAALRQSMLDVARRADDAALARDLAQSDLDRTRRQADAAVAAVAAWRTGLLVQVQVLEDTGPMWEADAGVIRRALGFRPYRFAGTRADLAAAVPTLLGRAAALGAVCTPATPELQAVIGGLQAAVALLERMDNTAPSIEAAAAQRAAAVAIVRERRAELQAELRRVTHLWAAARLRPTGGSIPPLDLTWVLGAVGRRRWAADEG